MFFCFAFADGSMTVSMIENRTVKFSLKLKKIRNVILRFLKYCKICAICLSISNSFCHPAFSCSLR